MAVGSAVSALNRPGWIRKAQQVFTARFALAARRPVRRLPPSPGWTWRCALRKANGRKSLREYPRRSGVYAAPNGSATALPKLVLESLRSLALDQTDPGEDDATGGESCKAQTSPKRSIISCPNIGTNGLILGHTSRNRQVANIKIYMPTPWYVR